MLLEPRGVTHARGEPRDVSPSRADERCRVTAYSGAHINAAPPELPAKVYTFQYFGACAEGGREVYGKIWDTAATTPRLPHALPPTEGPLRELELACWVPF